jgi:hypothetical protein
MTAEIIDLAARRNQRIVRVVRRPRSADPYALVIPAAALAGFVLWTAFLTIAFTTIREGPG